MSNSLKHSVSLHPYFTVNDGQMDAFKAIIQKFIAKTESESGCVYYNFTINEEAGIVLCREAYIDAEALLHHVESVGPIIEEALTISEMSRLEIHGPAAELEPLKAPFADLGPDYYALEDGVDK